MDAFSDAALLFPLEGSLARALPGPFFWSAVRRRCRSGELLFPSIARRNVNNLLRAILKKLEPPHADRYSSHGFRRGAASELQSAGSQWSTVSTIGDWRSLAFKGYVDLANEITRDLSRRLVEDLSLDEEDDRGDYVRSLGATNPLFHRIGAPWVLGFSLFPRLELTILGGCHLFPGFLGSVDLKQGRRAFPRYP